MGHNAIRYQDEYQCSKCGKAWSVNEDEPECVNPMDAVRQGVKPSTLKKPLGIVSKHVWLDERIYEIENAMVRYRAANEPIPCEWFDELHDLQLQKERR